MQDNATTTVREGTSPTHAIDVGQALDEGRWGGYQKYVVFLTALTIIIDGVDNQLLGIAIPSIMSDWAVPRSAFAPILALGFVGMMVGGAVAGVVGDRMGRRFALISSVLLFGVATIGAAMSTNLIVLGTLRFFAGMGLQGAAPNAAALVSEYVPARNRPFAVTLIIVCIPLGATIAGLVAIPVLPLLGWRALFAIGGLLPIAVALVLMKALPESPRYLARHPNRWSELVTVLRRIGLQVGPQTTFVDRTEKTVAKASVRSVLSGELRADSLALCGAFFFCLLAVYTGTNWVPSVLTGAGLSLAVASTGITAYNLGGVAGAIGGALAIGRFGSKISMMLMALGAMAGALTLRSMTITADSDPTPIIVMLGIMGGLINATQVTMYTLAAHVYPTAMRATGVGTASSVGRLGAIISPYAGNWALEMGGSSAFFGLIALAMLAATGTLAVVRRHIVGSGGRAPAPAH